MGLEGVTRGMLESRGVGVAEKGWGGDGSVEKDGQEWPGNDRVK